MNEDNQKAQLESSRVAARINRALGLFLSSFGLIVASGIFFTPTLAGKLTNSVCASILVTIGVGMIVRSRARGESGQYD